MKFPLKSTRRQTQRDRNSTRDETQSAQIQIRRETGIQLEGIIYFFVRGDKRESDSGPELHRSSPQRIRESGPEGKSRVELFGSNPHKEKWSWGLWAEKQSSQKKVKDLF